MSTRKQLNLGTLIVENYIKLVLINQSILDRLICVDNSTTATTTTITTTSVDLYIFQRFP